MVAAATRKSTEIGGLVRPRSELAPRRARLRLALPARLCAACEAVAKGKGLVKDRALQERTLRELAVCDLVLYRDAVRRAHGRRPLRPRRAWAPGPAGCWGMGTAGWRSRRSCAAARSCCPASAGLLERATAVRAAEILIKC